MNTQIQTKVDLFAGTQYEGLTYLQIRRMLTPKQIRALGQLNKRNKKIESHQKGMFRLIQTYR